jgi:hypothetical protein
MSDECPKCGHWPYDGSHGETGCMATGKRGRPCGCKHKRKGRKS